jgi:hypothetical protein
MNETLLFVLLIVILVVAVEEGIRLLIKGFANGSKPTDMDIPPWP